MSTDEAFRLLEALNVIRNVSGEVLRHHGTEVIATLQEIQSRFEGHSIAIVAANGRHIPRPTPDDCSPTPSSVSRHSSSISPDSDNSISLSLNGEGSLAPLSDEHASPQPPLSSIKKFIQGLEYALGSIKTVLSQEGHKMFKSEPEWTAYDPRIVDIQVARGSSPSKVIKLRRGLGQRSLAIEFNEWESDVYGISSVEQRAIDPSVQLNHKVGHIQEFLRINNYRFHGSKAARDGLEHGIKLLVCEMLLDVIGISAILFFRFTSFRSLKYEELQGLKGEVSDEIKGLAAQKADWLFQCQSEYDTWYKRVARQSSKRRRLSGLPIQSKRIQSLWPNDDQAIPTRISDTAATLPLQQTPSRQEGESQQSPASPLSSVQHLMPGNPLFSSDYNVSSGGCPNTNYISGRTTDSTAHQSFSHPSPVSLSQSNAVQEAHGSILRQDLQYNGTECTTDSVTYFARYPEAGGAFTGEAFDMSSDSGAVAGTVNYSHHSDPSRYNGYGSGWSI